MTLPRACKPELMAMPSFARSPVAAVFFRRSLPARSTKCHLEVTTSQCPSVAWVLLLPASEAPKSDGKELMMSDWERGRWVEAGLVGVAGLPMRDIGLARPLTISLSQYEV